MVSYVKLCCDIAVTFWSSLITAQTSCSLHSVVVLLTWPHCGWLAVTTFHQLSDTPGGHAGICVHTVKSSIDVCSWAFLFHKGFCACTLMKQYVTDNHVVTVDCGTLVVFMGWTHVHTGEESCHYWCYIPCTTMYGTNACNPTTLMTFGVTLV